MELLTDVTPSIDTYYLFRRRICEYQERTGIDLYADGAYQSPDNRKFAKNHNAMQLKTGKMQSGLSYFHSNLIILANCKKYSFDQISYSFGFLTKVKVLIWSKQGKIHILRETLQSMEYAQTCSTIESSLIEKATIIKTCKNNLLIDLKDSIALLLLSRYIIARKHLIEYFVCTHFLKYLIRVSMDLDFLPT